MAKKLNITERLDFNDIDLTAPEKVIEEVLTQLSEETNGIVLGKIASYSGHVMSYTQTGLSSIAAVIGAATDKEVNIQKDLGKLDRNHINLNVIFTLLNMKNINIEYFLLSMMLQTILLVLYLRKA